MIVAQPTATDTVQARPAQALVVEARGPDGGPKRGVVVRFSVLPHNEPKRPTELGAGVAGVSGATFGSFVVDSTGANGRVTVLVAFGSVAGQQGIAVHAPELGIVDTFALTVRPGAPAALQLSVRDTIVTVGARYSIGGSVVDRFKNPITGNDLTFSAGSAILSVDGAGTVSTASAGRGFIVARAGSLVDTARVSIVPDRKVVWYRSGTITLSDLEGGDATTLARSTHSSTFPHAAPGGQQVAFYEFSPGTTSTVSVVSLTGEVRQLVGAGGPAWPRYSGDGQWLYFSARRVGGAYGVSRIHPDGSGLQTIGPSYTGATYNGVGVSRDGSTLVVEDQQTLLVIDVATGTTRRIQVACSMPQFSPDGQRIACLGGNGLRVVDRDGSNQRTVVTRPIQTVGGVDWSPDGAWILVSGLSAPELISAAEGTVIPLSKLGGGQITQASFVP